MISMLFNPNKFVDGMKSVLIPIAILIVIAVILIAVIKSPNIKFIIFTVLTIIMVMASVYCIVQLRIRKTATGGIYGEIDGIYDVNVVTTVDSLNFEFENMEFTQLHDNTYRVNTTVQKLVKLPVGSSYAVLVNDMPCTNLSESNEYVLSKYSYTFLGSELQPIKTDTLTIRFAFYDRFTSLQLQTEGGAEVANLWNEFFNKNGFKITLTTDKYVEDNNITFDDGDISNFVKLNFVNGNKTEFQFAKTGSKLIDVPKAEQNGYVFLGWTLDNENVINFENYIVNSEVTFTAKFMNATPGLFDDNGNKTMTWGDMLHNYIYENETNGIYFAYEAFDPSFTGHLIIPTSVHNVSDPTRFGYESTNTLKSISFLGYIDYLDSDAFVSCGESLEEINFYGGVGIIKEYAFANLVLDKFTIPSNTTTIEPSAFTNCQIKELTIESSTILNSIRSESIILGYGLIDIPNIRISKDFDYSNNYFLINNFSKISVGDYYILTYNNIYT